MSEDPTNRGNDSSVDVPLNVRTGVSFKNGADIWVSGWKAARIVPEEIVDVGIVR